MSDASRHNRFQVDAVITISVRYQICVAHLHTTQMRRFLMILIVDVVIQHLSLANEGRTRTSQGHRNLNPVRLPFPP